MPTVPVPFLLVGGLLVGGVAGVAAESAGLSPIPESEASVEAPVEVLGAAVAVHDCPDGVVVAVLAGGDGVLATGRTDDGLWIEIRSPLDVSNAAWMSAGTLDPDGDLDGLPVHECAVEATTTTTTTGSTTTSSSTTSTSSTTVPEETTTSTSGPGSTTPTTPATTTSTVPDEPPTVGQPASSRPLIVTRSSTNQPCVGGGLPPATAVITISASDDGPDLDVAMSYRTLMNGNVVSAGGPLTVQGPTRGVYRATLGPLPRSVTPNVVGGPPTDVEITFVVTDSSQQQVIRVAQLLDVQRCNT